ncbi:hypothetical protein BGX34_002026 [Mortierella sp. NVP85]|nr:hypothetical protein BGX34_002026 [Mortierella sp. NVP85]
MNKTTPLDIPEILALVGSHISIWRLDQYCVYRFRPQDMLSCLLVSRRFRSTFLPILWRTFDEEGMSNVPVHILRKYTPYFRIHHNYGCRQDYPLCDREPCTRLSQITIYQFHVSLSQLDTMYIKSNPGLSFIGSGSLFTIDSPHNNPFSNLTRLECLDGYRHNRCQKWFYQILYPISTTLKILFIVCEEGSSVPRGIIFPNLKELHVSVPNYQNAVNLLQSCPGLESLTVIDSTTKDSSNNVIRGLSAGSCPSLKSLILKVANDQIIALSRMLEGRTGLKHLELVLGSSCTRLAKAIGYHASSLTHLSIVREWDTPPIVSFMLHILGACGQLQDVLIDNADGGVIDDLLNKDNWKNPGILENLELWSTPMILRGQRLRHLANPLCQHSLHPPSALSVDFIHGWRRVSKNAGLDHDREFLEALFDAAEGYCRLRTIKIKDVVYSKAVSRPAMTY